MGFSKLLVLFQVVLVSLYELLGVAVLDQQLFYPERNLTVFLT